MTASPFKILDAYNKSDAERFFGRDQEIETLYSQVYKTRLMLVYGQSGTGKTSLIQCGLASRFPVTDWRPILVRRGGDINVSLKARIVELARDKAAVGAAASIVDAIDRLYQDRLIPIYLIFDQFEELYVLGVEDEQDTFADTLASLLESEVSCRVIISIREEYLAHLNRLEERIPSLFDNRVRVEPMSQANLRRVILGTTEKAGIRLEDGEATAVQILANLSDNGGPVQLTYLQVYLNELWKEATKPGAPEPVQFTSDTVVRVGDLGDVMAHFLQEQTQAVQAEMVELSRTRQPQANFPVDAVARVLDRFVTADGTKLPTKLDDLRVRLGDLDGVAAILPECLSALEARRIIRNVDGLYELAHDALAGLIADQRGDEEKALEQAQKLIRDGASRYRQSGLLLTDSDLRRLQPVAFKLSLDEAEVDVLEASVVDRRWRGISRYLIGGECAAMTAAFLFFISDKNNSKWVLDNQDIYYYVRNPALLYFFDPNFILLFVLVSFVAIFIYAINIYAGNYYKRTRRKIDSCDFIELGKSGNASDSREAIEIYKTRYATILDRLKALVIDFSIFLVVLIGAAVAIMYLGGQGIITQNPWGYFLVTFFLTIFGYNIYFLRFGAGATLGMRLSGIFRTGLHGERVSAPRAAGIFMGFVLSCLTYGAPALFQLVTIRHQALHDLITETVVLRRGRPPKSSASAEP